MGAQSAGQHDRLQTLVTGAGQAARRQRDASGCYVDPHRTLAKLARRVAHTSRQIPRHPETERPGAGLQTTEVLTDAPGAAPSHHQGLKDPPGGVGPRRPSDHRRHGHGAARCVEREADRLQHAAHLVQHLIDLGQGR